VSVCHGDAELVVLLHLHVMTCSDIYTIHADTRVLDVHPPEIRYIALYHGCHALDIEHLRGFVRHANKISKMQISSTGIYNT
jgi:hypothetical protein